jgi:hypothetical protein
VLNLLEGQSLGMARQRKRSDVRGGDPTESFSTIPATPATDADSKVSMELSRWEGLAESAARYSGTHVERSQLLPINVELVVVELGELLYSRRAG